LIQPQLAGFEVTVTLLAVFSGRNSEFARDEVENTEQVWAVRLGIITKAVQAGLIHLDGRTVKNPPLPVQAGAFYLKSGAAPVVLLLFFHRAREKKKKRTTA